MKPVHLRVRTFDVNSFAISTVLSVLPLSTTTISSHHFTLSRHSRMCSSSFTQMIVAVTLGGIWGAIIGAPAPNGSLAPTHPPVLVCDTRGETTLRLRHHRQLQRRRLYARLPGLHP